LWLWCKCSSGQVRYSLAVYVEQCLPVVCLKRRRLRAVQLRADSVDRGCTSRLYTAAPAVRVSCRTLYFVLTRGLHGCGGHGDSAGNLRGRLRSVRRIRGIGLLTAQGHRGAGARREVTLHAAHAQHQHHSSGQVSAVCTVHSALQCTARQYT